MINRDTNKIDDKNVIVKVRKITLTEGYSLITVVL